MNAIHTISVQQLKDLDQPVNTLKNDIILSNNMEYKKNLFASPCRLDAFVLLFCVNGEADIQINLEKYKITSGMLAMNVPENIIQITDLDHFTIHPIIISSDFLKKTKINLKEIIELYMFAKSHPLIRLDYSELRVLEQYHILLESILSGNDIRKEEVVEGIIYSFLFKLDGLCKKLQENQKTTVKIKERSEEIFELFMEQLTLHHFKERGLTFYAERLGLTANYLSKLVREYSGKTATEWIDDYVILEAKTLIKNSQYTIQEIAYKLNFPTPTFFGKYFKRITGMSPKQYKNT